MKNNRKKGAANPVVTAVLWAIFVVFALLDCVLAGRLIFRAKQAIAEPDNLQVGESLPPEYLVETVPQETQALETEPPADETESGSSQEDGVSRQVAELMADMNLYEKVCQLFIVTPEQLTGFSGTVVQAGEQTRQALETWPVGGLIYFADNIETPEQVTEMIENAQSYSHIGLFISVDEEGGTVARVGSNAAMGTTTFPNMSTVAKEGGAEAAYQVGMTIGTELSQLGFNLDFAPVADVNSNPANPVIGSRAFSDDPETAAELVAACVKGFRDSGILCTLKHFPGHGDTSADSHTEAAIATKTLEEMEACEFLPFLSGIEAGAPFVMVGHISCPEITGTSVPASLSREMVTGILREQLGFDGIVITDSMQMAAVTDVYSSDAAAVAAVKAGVDIILMPSDMESAINGILSAVESGELTQERIDESVARILSVKLEQGIIHA